MVRLASPSPWLAVPEMMATNLPSHGIISPTITNGATEGTDNLLQYPG